MYKQIEIIFYVSDQYRSSGFYENLLGTAPVLNVPGMTEFELMQGLKLGLMPEGGIAKIITPALPHPNEAAGIPRCELYLSVEDVEATYKNALACGATPISPVLDRDWGDRVAYVADPDGHVIAFAQARLT